MDVDDLDEATRQILLKAKVHPEYGTRLQCIGEVGGVACNDQLCRCRECRKVGCWAASCSMQLFDRGNVCQRCGYRAGMNRNVKVSAVELMRIWEKLHGAAASRS